MDSDMLQIVQKNVYHVYLRSGTGSVYTDKERTKVMNAVKTCQFETKSKILVETNNKLEALTLKCNGEVIVPRKDTILLEILMLLIKFNLKAQKIGKLKNKETKKAVSFF